ncbi:MAG: hydrogenase 2 operon protein HybA [Azospirillum sp.]|nr:hydrogenase 2 operon protein HybA [Azospirillum sp.]
MSVSRRDFLRKAVEGGAAAAAAVASGGVPEAEAAGLQRPPRTLPPDAVGLLYDGTLCIGCKACVKACKDANGMPPDIHADQRGWNQGTWDSPQDLSAKTLNIIKLYTDGTMAVKDRETDGYAFSKRQCQHCTDPSCISACPVSAMTKDPSTGIVSHHPDRCIGCRYCVLSCPFGVPKFDFEDPFGRIHKCQLCNHRLAENKLPGCVDVCPTGATLFGRTADLEREAERRLTLKPGDRAVFPRGGLGGTPGGARPSHEKVVAAEYQQHIYGKSELGGTQCLMLSGVPFDKLNLPTNVPDYGYPTLTEGIQGAVYQSMVTPVVVLGGLLAIAHRNVKGSD